MRWNLILGTKSRREGRRVADVLQSMGWRRLLQAERMRW